MDGARLNFSHGTHEEHAANARLVRAAQEEVGRPIALIADLQGPKLRIGELEQPISLRAGDKVVVTGRCSSRATTSSSTTVWCGCASKPSSGALRAVQLSSAAWSRPTKA
jgi:pyruvate kinase